ncbi:MAG: glycosyltransferase [Pseudomonadota bacterium]
MVQAKRQRVAFLLDNLAGGGAERVVLTLARELSQRGYDVDLLVCERRGELSDQVSGRVHLIELQAASRIVGFAACLLGCRDSAGALLTLLLRSRKLPKSLRYLPAVRAYLQSSAPAVLIAALPKANVCAVLANRLAGSRARVFVGVHIALSMQILQARRKGKGHLQYLMPLLRYCYHLADGVIAVSAGVRQDAIELLGLDATRVKVVYNPIEVTPCDRALCDADVHPWFSESSVPVVVGVGRLVEQKNFPLLMRAFALLLARQPARLIIVGGDQSGDQLAERRALEALAQELGIERYADLVGYQQSPQEYLHRANLFVLSSAFEGFGNVLVEALLAGCPIVSTDCPSGPREILRDGEFGALVSLGSEYALAQAIQKALQVEHDKEALRQRGEEFSVEKAVQGYQRVLFEQGVGTIS